MSAYNSLIDEAIKSFSSLPGIGRKSALRLVLHMLDKDESYTESFVTSLVNLRSKIKPCNVCGNYTDTPVCHICLNPQRKEDLVCVVESIRDLLAIEQTGHYRGKYHVLGGLISPLDGIGPADLRIDQLIERVKTTGVKEVIMAISPTIDGETTIFYIAKQLADLDVTTSQIARGVAFGGELEYTDELTLSRSIQTRIPYQLTKTSDSSI